MYNNSLIIVGVTVFNSSLWKMQTLIRYQLASIGKNKNSKYVDFELQ